MTARPTRRRAPPRARRGGPRRACSTWRGRRTTRGGAGSYATDPWSFAGDANHTAATGTVADSIAKAEARIAVTPYSVTYDGAAHTATGTATGAAGEPLTSLLDLAGTTHTAAGSYGADAWSFAGDANHTAATGTVADAIAKANAGGAGTPYTLTYYTPAPTPT